MRDVLGATAARISVGLLRRSLTLTGIGLAIGLPVSLLMGDAIEIRLYGVPPHDLAAFAVTFGLLTLTATIASWIPARRALRISPVIALRVG